MIRTWSRTGLVSAPSATITCSLCGLAFDPTANPACPSCPLASGCTIVCCPRCGHDTVDPARSSVVQLGARVGRLLRRSTRAGARAAAHLDGGGGGTLADVAPGESAVVRALDGLGHAHREHLQAYGLAPGRRVHVLQHAPVTVVQVEHTQVAFESHLAAGITVDAGDSGS